MRVVREHNHNCIADKAQHAMFGMYAAWYSTSDSRLWVGRMANGNPFVSETIQSDTGLALAERLLPNGLSHGVITGPFRCLREHPQVNLV